MGIGDWVLGPIPNPQSPLIIFLIKELFQIILFFKLKIVVIKYKLKQLL